MLANKRVLVTGAAGFIGSHLSRHLQKVGAQVVALEHTPGKGDTLRAEGITVVQGDITDSRQMQTLLEEGTDIVIHVAAWLRGGPASNYHRVNVEATRNLAEASAQAGVERFVYVSSIAVYGPFGANNVDEAHPIALYNDRYGGSKIKAEWALRELAGKTGISFSIVRPGMVYGPRSRAWAVRLGRWAKQGRMPLINGGQGTCYPVFVDNLVDLLMLCAVHPAAHGEAFNGVDDGPVSLREFLGAFMEMIPTDRAVRLPGWIARIGAAALNPFVPDYNLNYIADQMMGRGQILNWKAKELLGWELKVSMQEGLKITEDWLKSTGIL